MTMVWELHKVGVSPHPQDKAFEQEDERLRATYICSYWRPVIHPLSIDGQLDSDVMKRAPPSVSARLTAAQDMRVKGAARFINITTDNCAATLIVGSSSNSCRLPMEGFNQRLRCIG